MADAKLVGTNYTPQDLVAKVTGKAKYAEDFRVDGMLFCKLLLSPMPHARVRNIDAGAALAMQEARPAARFERRHADKVVRESLVEAIADGIGIY